jgi:lysophospholipase L1-like esterase
VRLRHCLVVVLATALVHTGVLAKVAGAEATPPRGLASRRAAATTQTPGVASLADCLRSGRPLLALFLIDISGSLKQTDPSNQRVAGVKTALDGLASLQSATTGKTPPKIDVQLDGFSVGLDTTTPWTSLDRTTIDQVKKQADTFAAQNGGQDTDYYAALDGARQALANETANGSGTTNACKAILWFTDGQYDVIQRLTPDAVATLGRTKAYAPEIALDTPGGGLQLIARGKQLLCQAGGLADRIRADGIVTIAVAIDTQISPDDQAFLNAVATGNGCGTPPNTPSGASLQTADLSQLVLSFDAVASGTAGGTQVGDTHISTPCPGTPCQSGTQHFSVDKSLHRVHIVSLAGDDGIDISVAAPGVRSPLRVIAGKSGSVSLGGNLVHFTWIDAHTCILDIDLGALAAGDWTLIFIGPATLTAPNPVRTQLHVYTDITPRIVAPPVLRVGTQGSFNVSITNSHGQSTPRGVLRHTTVSATATNPITGQRQDVRVEPGSGEQFRLLYRPGAEVSSITLIQITIVIITIGGIQLAPIQRTYRVPIELPPQYPRLQSPELNLSAPEGTAGDTTLPLLGGTANGCAWVDAQAPQTGTPGIQVNYTGAPTSRGQCLQLDARHRRSLPLTVIPNPDIPGVINTSIALHIVVVHLRIIIIIIPVTLTLTTQALPQNGPLKRIVALGDSYSSGEGNPPFDIRTIQPFDLCHRSPQSWPSLIGVDPSYLLACSGAKTINLTTNGQTTAPPDNVAQIQRLAAINATAPVDVVTVMIGGNDIGFSGILGECYLIRSCLKNPKKNEATVDTLASTLQNTLLPAIKKAAPQAQIFLISYPNILPPKDSQVTGCPWLNSGAYTRMTNLERYLLTKESAVARADGVTLVDTSQALKDHAMCSKDPWIHKIDRACIPVILNGATAVDPAAAYCAHPVENATQHGQRAIADLVRSAITSPPPSSPTAPSTGAGFDPAVVAHDQAVVATIFKDCAFQNGPGQPHSCSGSFGPPVYTPDGKGGQLYAIELFPSDGDGSARGSVFFFDGEHLLNAGPALAPEGPVLGNPPMLPGSDTYTAAIPDAQVATPGASPGGVLDVARNGVSAAGPQRFSIAYEISTPDGTGPDGTPFVSVAGIGNAGTDTYVYAWNGSTMTLVSGTAPSPPVVLGGGN